jgi:hypothetical protein
MVNDSSELDSRLETRGTRLCLPLEEGLEVVLERFGFHADQEVVVRLTPDRLEIRPRNTPGEIQVRMKRGALELQQIAERVKAWAAELPALAEEEMGDEMTWAEEVRGMLECLLGDNLVPAIRKLETVDELLPPPAGHREEPDRA